MEITISNSVENFKYVLTKTQFNFKIFQMEGKMKTSIKTKVKAPKKTAPTKNNVSKTATKSPKVKSPVAKAEKRLDFRRIHQSMVHDFKKFYNELFAINEENESYNEALNRIRLFLNVMERRNIEDFDLVALIKYRVGKKRNPASFIEEQPAKSLIDVMCEGFDVPADVSLLKLEVRPAIRKADGLMVMEKNIYEVKFGISQKEQVLTEAQLKSRYNLGKDDMLLTTEDLEGKIFKFYAHDVNKDPNPGNGYTSLDQL